MFYYICLGYQEVQSFDECNSIILCYINQPRDQFRTTDAQDAEFDAFFDEMAERHKDVLPLSDDCLEDL